MQRTNLLTWSAGLTLALLFSAARPALAYENLGSRGLIAIRRRACKTHRRARGPNR